MLTRRGSRIDDPNLHRAPAELTVVELAAMSLDEWRDHLRRVWARRVPPDHAEGTSGSHDS
jgi:hypothetical protein